MKKKKTLYKNPLDLKLFVVIIVFTDFLCVQYVFNYLYFYYDRIPKCINIVCYKA